MWVVRNGDVQIRLNFYYAYLTQENCLKINKAFAVRMRSHNNTWPTLYSENKHKSFIFMEKFFFYCNRSHYRFVVIITLA